MLTVSDTERTVQMNRLPLTITASMLDAGASALEQCRVVGHDARSTAHVVFNAMLCASQWSPAARIRPAWRVKPALPAQFTFDGKRLPRNPLTLADFDSEGKRFIGHDKAGKPHYAWLQNYWYLAPKYRK